MWPFALLLSALIIWRVVWPMRIYKVWKIVIAVTILLAAFKFQILHLLGGPMFFAPELPRWLLFGSAWCYAVVFLLFFLLLAAETVQLFLRLARLKTPLQLHNKINLGLVICSVLLASAGIFAGTAMPRVREVPLHFSSLPPQTNALTIAVLTDLHVDAATDINRVRAIVEETNRLQPDLIVLLGDLVDGTVEKRSSALQPLRALSARYGVFAVPGNHEYYSGYREWMTYLPTLGIKMLLNNHETLPNGLVVAGVTDRVASRQGEAPPDIAKSLTGVSHEKFKLLLAHQPSLANEAAKHGISLQLSGHTHGGMIWGIDRLVGFFNANFVSGLYHVGQMQLYVSNGSGIWNGFPIRLGRNAEITLIRLSSSLSLSPP